MRKPLRILKTIPVKHGLDSWGPANRALLESVGRYDVTYELWDAPESPVDEIWDESSNALAAGPHVQLVREALGQGYAAIAMGCLYEPGVDEAKALGRLPIVGALEASVYMAATIATCFSIVMGSSTGANMVVERVEGMGLGKKLASIHTIDALPLQFAGEQRQLPDLMLEAAQKAIAVDGARCIICYGGITVLKKLRAELSVPVLNPQQCQVLLAESLCRALAVE